MSLIDTEYEAVEYISIDGKKAVRVCRDMELESPRETDDGLLGTFLTWHRGYRSPDENRWHSAEDWIAHLLDERLSDREMLTAISSGRIDGLRVIEHGNEDYSGRNTIVQSRVRWAWNPTEPFWDDVITLDARDLMMIEAGCDWCGDSLAEEIAPRFGSLELLGESGMAILPVYMLDHSGVCYSTRDFRDPWDSGLVGFISTTQERVIDFLGGSYSIGQELVVDILREEVDEYDAWVNGEVYMIEVESASTGADLTTWLYDTDFDMHDERCVSEAVGFTVEPAGELRTAA